VDLAFVDMRVRMSLQEILTAFNYFIADVKGKETLAVPLGPVCLVPEILSTIICQMLTFDVGAFKTMSDSWRTYLVPMSFPENVRNVAMRVLMSDDLQTEAHSLEVSVCFGLTTRVKFWGLLCGSSPLRVGDVLPFLRPTRCGSWWVPAVSCGPMSSGIAFRLPKMVAKMKLSSFNSGEVSRLTKTDLWGDPVPRETYVHVRNWDAIFEMMEPGRIYMPQAQSSSADLYWRVSDDMLVMWQMKMHVVQKDELSFTTLSEEVNKAVPWAALRTQPKLEMVFVLVYHVAGVSGLPEMLEWKPVEDHQGTVLGWWSEMDLAQLDGAYGDSTLSSEDEASSADNTSPALLANSKEMTMATPSQPNVDGVEMDLAQLDGAYGDSTLTPQDVTSFAKNAVAMSLASPAKSKATKMATPIQGKVDVVVLNIHGARFTIGSMSAEPLLVMRG
jgi:hypothetical protein